MDPKRIKSIRHLCGENTATFAARFARSARTIEDWEQGRRNPDPLAVAELIKLEHRLKKKAEKKKAKG